MTAPRVVFNNREVHHNAIGVGDWILPFYDRITGKTAWGDNPCPERVTRVDRSRGKTIVTTETARGEVQRVFTGEDKIEAVM